METKHSTRCSVSLRVLNNEPEWESKQTEDKSFSKICFIPALGLSCFGCCGHHFKDKATMHRFFDNNGRKLKEYLAKGKTHKDFMWREYLVSPCGGCYSLVREKDEQGRDQYICGVHPLKIGGEDIRPGYCEHDYLCATAAHVNKMTEAEKALFYQFLQVMNFNSYDYSMINSRESLLLEMYREWKQGWEAAQAIKTSSA
jgi:hypothetical protein